MINIKGIIQNNHTATDFIHNQMKNNSKFKILSKKEERKLIESFVELELDENGNGIIDETTERYQKYLKIKNEIENNPKVKNRNLKIKKLGKMYWSLPRKMKWLKPEEDFRKLLVMHNLQAVASIAQSKCQQTRDFDNMYAKGLYGLTFAANDFNPFCPVIEEDKENPGNYIPKIDESGNIEYIKFNTHAQSWIFKYVMSEFYHRSIKVDNNSTSMNEFVTIKNNTSTSHTLENYIDDMLSPDYNKPKTLIEQVSSDECVEISDMIKEYVTNTNELSSMEKNIFIDAYYNEMKSKDIIEKYNINPQFIISTQRKTLTKLRNYLMEEKNIKSMEDIVSW